MRTASVIIAVAMMIGLPATAHAGRTFYGWLYNTEVMPERGTEVQSWLDEENGRRPNDIHWTTWGFSALIGVTDQLTLAFPLEMVWRDSDVAGASFTLDQFGVEARYRLIASAAKDAPPFAPLVRVAVKRDVIQRNTTVFEGDLVVSTTTPTGGVHAVVDVGVVADVSPDEHHLELRPGAGVSFKVVGELRLGVEGYGELSVDDQKKSWYVVGPNIAWTQGRFWVSAAFGVGVYHIDTAPRATWGIMF